MIVIDRKAGSALMLSVPAQLGRKCSDQSKTKIKV
jgi:hypothetical protein